MYISKQIQYKIRKDLNENIDDSIETIFLEINQTIGKNIIIGVIYRPPNNKIELFENAIDNITQIIQPLAVDGFVFSYLRFSACYEDRNTTIRFRNKRFNQFLTIVIVIINIVAIYGPLKSNMIILYQITQLSEQKYRLAIPFAENNFGPFEHIVFVIVLFESPSKTLFRVLFPRLYLQICIFYQYISISCPTVSSK